MNSYQLYVHGKEHQQAGEIAAAIQAFRQSIELFPHFKSYLALADAYLEVGDTHNADCCIKRAFELHPKSNEAGCRYAELLHRGGDTSAAMQVINNVLIRSPTYGPAMKLLGIIFDPDEK